MQGSRTEYRSGEELERKEQEFHKKYKNERDQFSLATQNLCYAMYLLAINKNTQEKRDEAFKQIQTAIEEGANFKTKAILWSKRVDFETEDIVKIWELRICDGYKITIKDLELAIRYEAVSVFEFLYTKKENLNEKDRTSLACLTLGDGRYYGHSGCSTERLSIIKFLCEQGFNFTESVQDLMTTVYQLACKNYESLIPNVLLIARHVNPGNHLIDHAGNTPLHCLSSSNSSRGMSNAKHVIDYCVLTLPHLNIAEELLTLYDDHGMIIPVDAPNHKGKTALHLIADTQQHHSSNYSDFRLQQAKILLMFGASELIEDNKGQTPMDVARNSEMQDLLCEVAFERGKNSNIRAIEAIHKASPRWFTKHIEQALDYHEKCKDSVSLHDISLAMRLAPPYILDMDKLIPKIIKAMGEWYGVKDVQFEQ